MLFTVSLVYASQTRLAEMGLQNWMIDDDANIWFSPAYINDYPNRVWIDIGLDYKYPAITFPQWGGVSLSLLGDLGIFFNRPYTGLTSMVGTTLGDISQVPTITSAQVTYAGPFSFYPGYSLATLAPANKIDVFYGFALGPLMKLGVSINYANSYVKNESALDTVTTGNSYGSMVHEQSTQEINIGAGVTLVQLGPIPQIDIIGYVRFPMVNNTYLEKAHSQVNNRDYTEDIKLTNAGSYNLGINSRLKLLFGDLACLVYGGWKMDNLPSIFTRKRDIGASATLEGDLKQDRLYSSNNINFGVALNYQIKEKVLLVCAAGINYSVAQDNETETDPMGIFTATANTKGEYKWSQTSYSIPINIGVEYQPWGLRAGFGVTYQLLTTETIDPDYNANGTKKDEIRTSSPWQATAPVSISLGLSNQIADGISFDLLICKFTSDLVYPFGTFIGFTTQMSLMYKF